MFPRGDTNPGQAIAIRADLNGNPSDTGGQYEAFTAIDVASGGSAQYTAFKVEFGYTEAIEIQSGKIRYFPENDLTFENGIEDILTLKHSGNVGIGTTSPGSKLEVDGTIHSTSGGIKFPDGSIQTTANTNSQIIEAKTVYQSSRNLTVNFTNNFSSTPVVVVSSQDADQYCSVRNINTSSCQIECQNDAGNFSPSNINYIALGN